MWNWFPFNPKSEIRNPKSAVVGGAAPYLRWIKHNTRMNLGGEHIAPSL